MSAKRILCLWFPRLGAERLLRLDRSRESTPFVTVCDQRGAQVLASLSHAASIGGLTPGQSLRDARAMCPNLISQPDNPVAEAEFLSLLRRWAGKFSPWVGEEGADGLIIDITGCAHLFGGEQAMLAQAEADCARLGLSVRAGLADTVGAAWALARFAGISAPDGPGGDAIDQEARATRSRAAKTKRRHWTRGGAGPALSGAPTAPTARIAASGATRRALAPLPMAALRLPDDIVASLARLGLRCVGDVLGTPRAGLARRFGRDLVRRLDQALGMEPEPVSPARPPLHFAVRMGLPEPIGLESDLLAGLDRLLPELSARLKARGRGARQVRLDLSRSDRTSQSISVGLARASADPARLRPLLAMKLPEVDAGFGIDRLRLVVTRHEALAAQQHHGPISGGDARAAAGSDAVAIDDLMGRIGARLGLEALTRLHPADSHIPEKAALILAAAWSEPARNWVAPPGPARPLLLWRPEPVMVPPHPGLPPVFRWRGRDHAVASLIGPERITPEWWLADAEWRNGARDYWEVVTKNGARLWLYYAHGAALSPGWFCQGQFG